MLDWLFGKINSSIFGKTNTNQNMSRRSTSNHNKDHQDLYADVQSLANDANSALQKLNTREKILEEIKRDAIIMGKSIQWYRNFQNDVESKLGKLMDDHPELVVELNGRYIDLRRGVDEELNKILRELDAEHETSFFEKGNTKDMQEFQRKMESAFFPDQVLRTLFLDLVDVGNQVRRVLESIDDKEKRNALGVSSADWMTNDRSSASGRSLRSEATAKRKAEAATEVIEVGDSDSEEDKEKAADSAQAGKYKVQRVDKMKPREGLAAVDGGLNNYDDEDESVAGGGDFASSRRTSCAAEGVDLGDSPYKPKNGVIDLVEEESAVKPRLSRSVAKAAEPVDDLLFSEPRQSVGRLELEEAGRAEEDQDEIVAASQRTLVDSTQGEEDLEDRHIADTASTPSLPDERNVSDERPRKSAIVMRVATASPPVVEDLTGE